jgi:hypothetical protein
MVEVFGMDSIRILDTGDYSGSKPHASETWVI